MDMIYADANFIDQGVLQDYSFDMEYGVGEKDTNTFECKIQKYNPAMMGDNPLTQDFILYVENTEYGGIIDRIESNTKTGEITLSGRSWHGLLNSFVIEPPTGLAYRSYYGTSSEVLAQMIEDVGLEQFFVVDEDPDDDIIVTNFEVRYEPLYDAMIRMLNFYSGKFKCYYKNGQVHILGVLACNYAVNEEFDSSQVPFKVGITYNNINHMICMGQGNGEKRAIIHLFTDDNGVLQEYKLVDDPIQDSDYILDKSQQVVVGVHEKAYVYDYPNAEITYNYPLLTSQPADWTTEYFRKYYVQGDDDLSGNHTFNLIERVFQDRLHLLLVEPANWRINEGYKNYYTVNADCTQSTPVTALQEGDPECVVSFTPAGGKVGAFWDWSYNYQEYYEYNSISGTYSHVSANRNVKHDNYVGSRPIDWDWNYSHYNTRWWNGIAWVYESVSGVQNTRYDLQSSKPSNWETDDGWKSYYTKSTKVIKEKKKTIYKKGDFVTVEYAVEKKMLKLKKNHTYPEWATGKFYTEVTWVTPPAFPAGGVWFDTSTDIAPVWENYRYYKRVVDNTPKFKLPDPANGFYGYWDLHKNEEQIPEFVPNTYHYETEDRLKVLIEYAIQKLAELSNTSTLDIDLELETNYDVGDIVGSIDEVTGIEVNKPILRKTIKIKKDIVAITHEVE